MTRDDDDDDDDEDYDDDDDDNNNNNNNNTVVLNRSISIPVCTFSCKRQSYLIITNYRIMHKKGSASDRCSLRTSQTVVN